MNILKRAIRAGLLVIVWTLITGVSLIAAALALIVYAVAFVIGLPLVLAAGLCGAAAEGVKRCSGS